MSSTIIDHTDTTQQSGFSLKLGKSYITSDQSVTKIVEEHSKLQDDGVTIAQTFIGDNHITYTSDEHGRPKAVEGQKNILLEIKDNVDQQSVSDALNHVTQAERVLNPLGLAVIVTPSTRSDELTQV